MVEQYKKDNRFSPYTTLTAAAVAWHGLSPAQRALVIVDELGLPYLAGVPELTERAQALLDAVHDKRITGRTTNEDGYPLHPSRMQLFRESVAAWVAATDARLAAPAATATQQSVREQWLTETEVCALVGFSRATLWRRIGAGKIPEPAKHTGRNRWPASAITAYIETPPGGKGSLLKANLASRTKFDTIE